MAAVEKLVIDHLSLWTAAIKRKSAAGRGSSSRIELYGTKKLRELILELAVRGLLVPQDPRDEPASELLKKIAAEKARLIKEKKIRNLRPLPVISDDEKLMPLPAGWGFARLNDLGDWGAGATPSRNNPEFYGGNIHWFKSGELIADYISQSEETVTELALEKASLRCNKVGDVLLAMYGATIGKTAILSVPATTNQAVCACTPFSGFENTYLLTLLKAYKSRFIGMGAGGAQPNISREKIIEMIVAVPPNAEQHRIVAKVNELMALCDRLEQQTDASLSAHQALVETLLNALTSIPDHSQFACAWQRIAEQFDTLFTTGESIDQLKQTILQLGVAGKLVPQDSNDEPASELLKRISAEKAMLVKAGKIKKEKQLPPVADEEKLFSLPSGWEWCRLENLSLQSEAGWSPKCEETPRVGDNWAVLKVSAVTWGEFNPAENKALPPNLDPVPDYEVKPGDFLISRANTAELVARSVVVQDQAPSKLMMSDKIIRFKFSQKVCVPYMSLFNNSGGARRYYLQVAGGTSSSMKNVSRLQIQSLVVALPPFSEQKRIVAKVDELMALCDQLTSRLGGAQTIQLHLADALTDTALARA